MMRTSVRGFPWMGVILITIGCAMLIDRLHVYPVDWEMALWVVLMMFGGYSVTLGFQKKIRGRAFWGTAIALIGLFELLTGTDMVYVPSFYYPSVLILIVGLSFLSMYLCDVTEWQTLVPTLLFIILGAALMLSEMGYIYRWDVAYAVRRYWAVSLILFGGALLLKRRQA